MLRLSAFTLVICFGLSQPTSAADSERDHFEIEEKEDTPARYEIRRNSPLIQRRPDYEEIYYEKFQGRQKRADKYAIRMGLSVGSSSLDSSNSVSQRLRAGTSSDGGLSLGLIGSIIEKRYFSFDFDGQYTASLSEGRANVSKFEDEDLFIPEAPEGDTIRLNNQLYSLYLNYNVGMPLYIGSVMVRPKVGVGWALMGIKERFESPTGGLSNTEKRIHGAYSIVGVDVSPFPFISFVLDFSNSIWAEGRLSQDSGEGNNVEALEDDESVGVSSDLSSEGGPIDLSPPVNAVFQNAHFDRIRAGLFFRILSNATVGAQYTRRSFYGEGARDIQSQLMSLFMYEL